MAGFTEMNSVSDSIVCGWLRASAGGSPAYQMRTVRESADGTESRVGGLFVRCGISCAGYVQKHGATTIAIVGNEDARAADCWSMLAERCGAISGVLGPCIVCTKYWRLCDQLP